MIFIQYGREEGQSKTDLLILVDFQRKNNGCRQDEQSDVDKDRNESGKYSSECVCRRTALVIGEGCLAAVDRTVDQGIGEADGVHQERNHECSPANISKPTMNPKELQIEKYNGCFREPQCALHDDDNNNGDLQQTLMLG